MSTGTEQSHFPKCSRLGPCEIASSIGAGGMCEDWKSEFSWLKRVKRSFLDGQCTDSSN